MGVRSAVSQPLKHSNQEPECLRSAFALLSEWLPQGQYKYLYLLLAAPPYMAAANFVVITNGGRCALTETADIDQ